MADALHDIAVKRFAFNRWRSVYGQILALERRADKLPAKKSVSNVPECFGKLRKLGRGVYSVREILKLPPSHLLGFPSPCYFFHIPSLAKAHRYATKRACFAVQHANAQPKFSSTSRAYSYPKILKKFFLMRWAMRTWTESAEERGRETRLKGWDEGKAGKLFTGWKEKALRQRRHQLAEQ
ncbi:hypothetical protein BJY52DRAFT_1191937 [Lactarius psammicola]|nr:hypothetical protein BJY52DRAFT_1191937 [Lactarius psammicola]